jgi:hypothetical protein
LTAILPSLIDRTDRFCGASFHPGAVFWRDERLWATTTLDGQPHLQQLAVASPLLDLSSLRCAFDLEAMGTRTRLSAYRIAYMTADHGRI